MSTTEILVTIPELEGEDAMLAGLEALAPDLRVRHRPAQTGADVADLLDGVHVLYTWRMPTHLRRADALRWVQIHAAGIDGKSDSPIFDPAAGITVTNVAGAQAVSIAEYCLATMTMLARGFVQLVRDMATRTSNRSHSPPVELCGQTVGVLGYGHIGREVARLAAAHRMRVLALKRDPTRRTADGYQWPGTGDPGGTLPARIFGLDQLHTLLADSDFVVNCLPCTSATRDLIDGPAFAAMKPSAYFINVGRGGTVARDALVEALQSGAIAGAALDVFPTDPDPLPPDHPAWDLENIFISPHISGTRKNRQYLERTNEVFGENLRHFLAGEPLLNVVSRERGY